MDNMPVLKRAIEALQEGRPILLSDCKREQETDIAFNASCTTPSLVSFCLNHGKGLLCVALSNADASRLDLPHAYRRGRDTFETPFGPQISLSNGTSGISASARSDTIRALCDPSYGPPSFVCPGHVMTLLEHREGLIGRRGHTEGILALLRFAGLSSPGGLCEVLDDQGNVADADWVHSLSERYSLPIIDIESVAQLAHAPASHLGIGAL